MLHCHGLTCSLKGGPASLSAYCISSMGAHSMSSRTALAVASSMKRSFRDTTLVFVCSPLEGFYEAVHILCIWCMNVHDGDLAMPCVLSECVCSEWRKAACSSCARTAGQKAFKDGRHSDVMQHRQPTGCHWMICAGFCRLASGKDQQPSHGCFCTGSRYAVGLRSLWLAFLTLSKLMPRP